MGDNYVTAEIKPSRGADFIVRNCKKLKINSNTVDLAIRISNNSDKLDIATDH